ncbi:MAG: FGGY-family carbohydrate kinase [Dongiaceae bacterium]
MSRDLIVALDSGTSVVKALAFTLDGRQVGVAARPNRYETLPGGAVEQDPDATWRDAAAVLAELAGAVDDLPRRAAALAVTGQGAGTWLIDAAGRPAAPAWLWLDSRAAGIVAEAEASGARAAIYRHTGCGLNPCNQSSQLAWLERHRRAVLDRTATAFHCKDWLYFNLTGVRATDVTEGTFTFGDFRSRSYAPAILEALGIGHRRGLLPPMLDGSRHTDALSAAAAALTGLPAGLPVSLCCVDVVCTAIGAGLSEPGRPVGCSILGSTGMHMRYAGTAADVTLAPAPTGYTMPLPIPGALAQMQSNMAATLNIDWIVGLACEAAALLGAKVERRAALAALDARVLEARPGAALYHPYIHEAGERGPFVDATARAQLTGLSARAGFLDLVRAVYEGLALAARDCYGAMGHVPSEIRVAGGAARSRAMKLLLASAMGVPVRESVREEAGAAGAAMMAAVAVGAAPDMAAAAERWVAPMLRDTIAPDPELARLFDRLFPIYLETRQAMPPIWGRLAAEAAEHA